MFNPQTYDQDLDLMYWRNQTQFVVNVIIMLVYLLISLSAAKAEDISKFDEPPALTAATSSTPSPTEPPFEQMLEGQSDDQKVSLIKAFLRQNARVKSADSILYGQQALAILNRQPDVAQATFIHAHMALAKIFLGQKSAAQQQIQQALSMAQEHNHIENRVICEQIFGQIMQDAQQIGAAQQHYDQALAIASEHGLTSEVAQTHYLLGLLNIQSEKTTQALEHMLLALPLFKASQDPLNIALTGQSIGRIYYMMADYDSALSLYLGNIQTLEQLNQQSRLAVAYNNIAMVYKELTNYPKAIDYLDKSMVIKQQENNQRGILFALANLGELHRLAKHYPTAKNYLSQALTLAISLDHRAQIANINLYLGRLSTDEAVFEQAKQYLNTALEQTVILNSQHRIANVYLAISQLFLAQNQPQQAIDSLLKGLALPHGPASNPSLIKIYQALSNVYEIQQDYQNALKYQHLYQQLHQETMGTLSLQRIEALTMTGQIKEQAQQFNALSQADQINQLTAKTQQAQRNSYLFFVSLLFLLGAFAYYRFNRTRAINVQLAARKQIQKGREQLKLALWGSGDELWDWHIKTGYVIRTNPFNNVNLPTRQQGKDISIMINLVHPDDYQPLKAAFDRHFSGQTDFFEASYRLKSNDGQWLWVLDRGKIVEYELDGTPIRMAGTLRDISNIKAHEAALTQLNAELEDRVDKRTKELRFANNELINTLEKLKLTQNNLIEAEKMAALGRLVAGMAHELNTPLGTTITAVSILQSKTEQLHEQFNLNKLSKTMLEQYLNILSQSCDLIYANSNRSANLVQEFKQVAGVNQTEEARPIDLKRHLEEITAAINCTTHTPKHLISLSCDQSIIINSYPDCLFQVIKKLFGNSVMHGFSDETPGLVKMSVSTSDHYVVIEYRDNGVGIPKTIEDQIFEPFFTTKRHYGSTGLGLHIIFNIVTQSLKGTINYYPNYPTGACFIIQIPLNPFE